MYVVTTAHASETPLPIRCFTVIGLEPAPESCITQEDVFVLSDLCTSITSGPGRSRSRKFVHKCSRTASRTMSRSRQAEPVS